MEITSPAARGLFRAILEDPRDDVPRLLLADVLEEAGEGERAEFIRVGCEVARREQDCRDCSARTKISQGVDPDVVRTWCKGCEALRRRERELLEEWRLAWEFPFWQILNPRCETFTGPAPWSFAFRRGFAAAVTLMLTDWCGQVCPVCSGWRSREAYCEHCHGTGRTGGHGPGLVRAAPIEQINIVSVHDGRGEDMSTINNLLREVREQVDPHSESDRLLTWARQEAGLPALTF